MRRYSIIATFLAAFVLLLGFEACKKDRLEPEEFIADDASFSGFMNWSLDATNVGADPALGGMAHGGNDSTVTRNVYFKDGQDPVDGEYPVGTIIVKHSKNPSGTVDAVTAMVKRGNNFNPDVGDWEFFMLNLDGSIATDSTGNVMRGANLMNGMCGNCHSSASSKDFVFSK